MSFLVVCVGITQSLKELFILFFLYNWSARAPTFMLFLTFLIENPVEFSSDLCCSSFKLPISKLILVDAESLDAFTSDCFFSGIRLLRSLLIRSSRGWIATWLNFLFKWNVMILTATWVIQSTSWSDLEVCFWTGFSGTFFIRWEIFNSWCLSFRFFFRRIFNVHRSNRLIFRQIDSLVLLSFSTIKILDWWRRLNRLIKWSLRFVYSIIPLDRSIIVVSSGLLLKNSELLVFIQALKGWSNEVRLLSISLGGVGFMHAILLVFHFLSQLLNLMFLLSNLFLILLPLGLRRGRRWLWGIVPLRRMYLSSGRICFGNFINFGLVSKVIGHLSLSQFCVYSWLLVLLNNTLLFINSCRAFSLVLSFSFDVIHASTNDVSFFKVLVKIFWRNTWLLN